MINIERKKLCLSRDFNLRSAVLRTGILTIRPLRHIYQLRNKPLSFTFQSKTLLNVILYYNSNVVLHSRERWIEIRMREVCF